MAQTPVRFGVEVQAGIPQSDLKTYVDSNPFVGVGVQATTDLSSTIALRGRLDYNRYADAKVDSITTKASNLELAADCLIYVDGMNRGIYFLVGPAAVRWDMEAGDSIGSSEGTTTKLGLNAGVGYQVNHNLGVEARYAYSSLSPNFNAPSVALSVNYRF